MCPVPHAGEGQQKALFPGPRKSAAAHWYYLEKLSVFGEFSVT